MAGKDCAAGEGAQVETKADENGQRQIVRIVTCGAGAHKDTALKAMRQARASIADDGAVSGSIREKVLQQLDASIARMERDAN